MYCYHAVLKCLGICTDGVHISLCTYCMSGVSVVSRGCDILVAGACISLCIVEVLALGLSICMGYLYCWCPY